MKFAVIALLSTANAVSLQTRLRAKVAHPTGAEIVAHCGGVDDDKDHVSKREAWRCISAEDPSITKEQFGGWWDMANFGADGADAAEIDALIAEHSGASLAQIAAAHPTGAEIVAHCGGVDDDKDHVSKREAWKCISAEDPSITKEQFGGWWDMANFGDDGADAAEIDALIAEHSGASLAQIAAMHPTGADIVAHCGGVDEDKDHVSKKEAWMCIHAEDPSVTKEQFGHFWDMADFGADGADAEEIDAIMAEMDGHSLAQLAAKEHPTGADIVAHCGGVDDDKDHVSKREAWKCISAEDASITKEEFGHFWDMCDFGADGADAEEIDAIMAEMDGNSLAQLAKF